MSSVRTVVFRRGVGFLSLTGISLQREISHNYLFLEQATEATSMNALFAGVVFIMFWVGDALCFFGLWGIGLICAIVGLVFFYLTLKNDGDWV